MRKIIMALAAVGIAGLIAGCSTGAQRILDPTAPVPAAGPGLLSPLVDSGTIAPSTRDKAKQVQAYAVTWCQFEPTLASAISLVNAAVGMGVSAIGTTLCNAVTSIPLADGGTRKIVVNGVRIKGKRIVAVLR